MGSGHPSSSGPVSTLNVGLRAFHPIWYLLQICRNVAALSLKQLSEAFSSNFINSDSEILLYFDYLLIYVFYMLRFGCKAIWKGKK